MQYKLHQSPSFIEEVWQFVRSQRHDPHHTCIVLPSMRAGLYFKHCYLRHGNSVELLPHVTTLHQFIDQHSPLDLIDHTQALVELYEVYRASGKQSFEEFHRWGPVLLNDFNEIDNYLVNASSLFSDLRNLKEIDEDWSYSAEQLSKGQEAYLDFWSQLKPLYHDFRQHLLALGKAYSGMQVRHFAEEVLPALKNEERCIYFAGFNALNPAEQKIANHCCAEGIAKIFWDADPYYLDDPAQEAGRFFNIGKKPHEIVVPGGIRNNPIDIETYGVPKDIGQVKLAGQLLQNLTEQEQQNTVVVLADEKLLVPLLNSLPSNITKVNITMGLPLNGNALLSLLEAVFELNLYNNSSKVPSAYFTAIIEHQFLTGIISARPQIVEWLRRTKFLDLHEFSDRLRQEGLDELLLFVQKWNDAGSGIEALEELVSWLKTNAARLNLGTFENEFLYVAAGILRDLKVFINRYSFIDKVSILYKLFGDAVKKQKVAVLGEPLQGLQIMGMLETRALDFENVIILGANEDLMPAGGIDNSLIPYVVKKHYGLPARDKKEAIYAYYVYRLLHRSKQVKFIYNNVVDDFGGSEKSRYLLQLEEELPRCNPQATITARHLEILPEISSAGLFAVPRTDLINEKIRKMITEGISPSAINTFLECPLNFYYKYILNLEEANPEQGISIAELGSLIHEVLEDAYKDVEGRLLNKEVISAVLHTLEERVDQAFAAWAGKAGISGQVLLRRDIAVFQLRRFFNLELERISQMDEKGKTLLYLASEAEIDHSFGPATALDGAAIKVKGKIDRIEKTDQIIYIIDYKTGYVTAGDLNIREWDELRKKPKAMQLALYGLALRDRYPGQQLHSGIYSLMNLEPEPLVLRLNKQAVVFDPETCRAIEQVVINVVGTMLDSGLPFVHNPRGEFCSYCK